ncbi:MAG: Beta-phosphoglucomutase [Myxococcales bacterium]|nr:Beta-phosphoglucomutase [Myxococcales bacterium]
MTDLKLLLADVDGTLVTPAKVLTPRARAAARSLRARGIELAITSGRPPRGMAMLVEPLGLTTPIAAFNGGLLVQPDLRTILEQRTLPRAVAVDVVDVLLHAGLDVWVYRGDAWFIRDRDAPHVATEQATVQFEPTVIADLHAVLDDAVKIVGVSDDRALLARCELDLRERVAHHASAARSQPYYLDVTHPDANKGMVARELSRRLDIPLSRIATIGDMPNDVLMFGLAGSSIAMGNASPEVQRSARFVTTSNDDEGFANAVERFVLPGAQPAQVKLGLPSSVQACLFDLDGVLTQTATLHAAVWQQTFDDYLRARAASLGERFRPFDPTQDYAQYVDGKPRSDGVRSFLAARGIQLPEGNQDDPPSAQTIHGIGNHKNEILLHLLREQRVATYESSVRYVRAAREAGLKTAVVSSSKNCREVLLSAGIADLFDVRIDGIIAEEQHLAGKPAPDTYLAAARALAVEPARAVVFEDALAGVEAGHAGHFGYVVGVDRIGQASELRHHGADVVVQDLATLLEAA